MVVGLSVVGTYHRLLPHTPLVVDPVLWEVEFAIAWDLDLAAPKRGRIRGELVVVDRPCAGLDQFWLVGRAQRPDPGHLSRCSRRRGDDLTLVEVILLRQVFESGPNTPQELSSGGGGHAYEAPARSTEGSVSRDELLRARLV